MQFRDIDGSTVRAFAKGDRLAAQPVNAADIGENILNLLYQHGGVRNDAQIGEDDSRGGHFLTPGRIDGLLDLARAASVMTRAGAQTINMNNREEMLLTVVRDPTPYWIPEAVTVPDSDAIFGKITLRAKSLKARVPISQEMLDDSANAPTVIGDLLAKGFAAELDRVALIGDGAAHEPRGLLNQTGVNTIAAVGTPASYADITSAMREIYEANYDGDPQGLAWVRSPGVAAVYDGLVDTTGQPKNPTPWAAAVSKFTTNKIGDASMIVGDFSQVVIGLRSQLRIRIVEAGTFTEGTDTRNAADSFVYMVLAYLRADVAVLRPSFFTVLTGVTTA